MISETRKELANMVRDEILKTTNTISGLEVKKLFDNIIPQDEWEGSRIARIKYYNKLEDDKLYRIIRKLDSIIILNEDCIQL